MSKKTVDERVVSMQFDNRNFEKNVSTTMSTLDKLKQKLKFTDSTKGLEDLGAAAKKVDMTGLGKAVETIQARFSALDVVAMTALSNITTAAMNAGTRMIKALTIDPITTGFKEYETQINAVQTILANTESKGTTLDDVTKALDELNKYADMTIYNFTEMTRNIGTFTAAGVDLDKSVTSIKGIANLAAVSGSTSQQASVAMYQLSQALAAGRVSLMDWNSVVNAGMGGELFQNALKRTATQMGYNVDALIEKYGSFRESLTQGQWLTAEVLTETLTQLSGAYSEADLIAQGYSEEQAKEITQLAETAVNAATKVKTFTQLFDTLKEAAQSGWTQTWEIIIGDFEEAKELLTGLSDFFGGIINNFSEARNTMLEGALGSKWDSFTEKINEAGVSTDEFQKKLTEVAKRHDIALDEMITKEGSLKKVIDKGLISKDILLETLKDLAGLNENTAKSTEDMTKKLEYFQKVVNDVWNGDYKNGKERVEALTKAGYNYAEVQAMVNKTVDGHKLTLEDLSDTQLKAVGYTEEEITAIKALAEEAEKAGTPLNELIEQLGKPTGRELLFQSLANMAQPVITIFKALGEAWNNAFPPDGGKFLYSVIEVFHGFSEALVISEKDVANITRTLKGVFAILDLISMVLGGGFKIGFKIFSEVLTTLWRVLGFGNATVLEITATIGDAIVAFRDWIEQGNLIGKVVGTVIPFIVKLGEAFVNLVKAGWNLPVVQGAVSKFLEVLNDIGSGFQTTFGKAIEVIIDFINKLASMKDVGIEDLSSMFSTFFNDLRESIKNVDFIDVGKNIIAGLINGISAGINIATTAILNIGKTLYKAICNFFGIHSPSTLMYGIGGFIIAGLILGFKDSIPGLSNICDSVVSTITNIFGAIPWDTLFAIGAAAELLYIMKKLSDSLSILAAPLEGFGEMFEGVGNVLNQTGKAIKRLSKAKAFSMKADAIKSIAIAIGILAASLVALSMIKPLDLLKAVAALAALAAVIVVLTKTIGNTSFENIPVGRLGIFLLLLGATLLIMSSVIKKLGSMSPEQAIQGFIGLAGMITAIGGILLAFGKIDWKSTKNIRPLGSMILKLSVALLLMATTVKLIGLLSVSEIIKGAAFITAFGIFVYAMTEMANKTGRNFSAVGGMMLKLSAALILMVAAVKLIDLLSVSEMIKGAVFIAGFVVFVKYLVQATKIGKNQEMAKLGTTLLGITVSMALMVGVCKLINLLSVSDIIKGIVFVGAFLVFVDILVNILSAKREAEIAKMGVTLLAMATAIGILAGISIILGFISPAHLVKGIAAIAALGAIMSMMIIATRGANDVKGNLIIMTVAIGIMAAAVAILSFIDPTRLLGASAALGLLMGMFALMTAMTKFATKSLMTLITITAVIAALAGVLALLSGLDTGSVLASSGALSALLLSMSASMLIVSKMGSVATKGLLSIAAMTAIVAVLAVMLKLMSNMDPNSTLANVTAIMTLLIGMTAVLGVLTLIGSMGSAAFYGLGALAALIIGLAGIMAALGFLIKDSSILDQGIEVLGKLGKGLGNFFGGIIGGFAEGVMSGLPGIGKSLSDFMTNLGPFIEGCKSLSGVDMTGAKSLAEMILILTGANILEGIASWLTGQSSMTEFANQLVPFGKAMIDFSNTVSGNIDEDAVTAAANAGKMMAEMNSNLPGTGGVVQWFMGEKNLSDFGNQLVLFGKAMVQFSNTISGKVDTGAIESVAAAGEVMTTLQNKVTSTGGVVQWFTGEKDLGYFGQQLVSFGLALTSFSATVSQNGSIDQNAIQAAANAGDIMATLQGKLEPIGGVVGWFNGENDLGSFGETLVTFGKALVDFSGTVSGGGINQEAVLAAANAGEIMVNLSKAVTQIDNGGWFSNTTTLTDFAGQLPIFGIGLAQYYDQIKNIDGSRLTSVTNNVTTLTNLIKGFDGINSDGVSKFTEAINSLALANIDGFLNAFNVDSSRLTVAVSGLVNAFNTGISQKAQTLATTMTNIINTIIETINRKEADFIKAGNKIIEKISKGIEDKKTKATDAIKIVLKSSIDEIGKYEDDFETAGKDLVKGFANGISANTYLATAKSKAMAQAAVGAAKRELDINSPSGVFYEIGDYTGLGFINALTNSTKAVYGAASGIGESARQGLTNAISNVARMIDSDMDFQPTIRPVLDLSDVESGAGAISGLFGMRPTVGLSSARTINSMVNSKLQNGVSTGDVVSAIQDLKGIIGTSSGDTYNLNGITYDDGSNIADAIQTLVRAARIERRK